MKATTLTVARIGAGVVCALGAVLAGCDPNRQVDLDDRADSSDVGLVEVLEQSDLSPTLDVRIADRNIVWCATLVSAWKDLEQLNGGPVRLRSGSQLAEALNRSDFKHAALPANSAVHGAGLVGDGIVETLVRKLDLLPGEHNPILLDQMRKLPADHVVAYAYLKAASPFAKPFDVLDPSPFGDASRTVRWFGLDGYSPPTQRELGKQVRILWHRYHRRYSGRGRFVIELLTSNTHSRLILARVAPKPTLRETVEYVLGLARKPNTLLFGDRPGRTVPPQGTRASRYADLLEDEDLMIPFIDIDLQGEFPDVSGQRVVSANPKLDGKPFWRLCQKVQFRLDHNGADMESEAEGGLFGGPVKRRFIFDQPFLVLLCEKTTLTPYFVLWIANDEMLVPEKPDSQ